MAVERREQWELLIGRLLLVCGDIELRLLQMHWNLSVHGGYDERLRRKGLGEKATSLLKSLDGQCMPAQLRKKVANLLNKAVELAKDRNLVAHNPLYMDVYADEEGNFCLAPAIRSLRGSEKQISLERLSQVVSEAQVLQAEFWSAVGTIGEAACEPANSSSV